MKQLKIIFFLMSTMTLLIGNTQLQLTDKEKEFITNNPIIQVGGETDWPPFDFVEDNTYQGIAKDYLEVIGKKSGLKFEYHTTYTWSQLLKRTKDKHLDLLPVLSKTKDREKYLSYTNSYLTIRDYLFSSTDIFNSIDELENKIIAVPKGYVQESFINENYPNIKILSVNNLLEAIDAVLLNKADALISNTPIISYLLIKYNLIGLHPQFQMNYGGSNLHMGIRNDYPILRDILQKGLDSITLKEKNDIAVKWNNQTLKKNELVLTKEEKEFIKNQKVLYIGNELNYKPYDYYENNQATGYTIDYIKLLFDKIGLEPIYVTDKWSSLYKKFLNNEIHLLPIITRSKEREKIMNFSKPYITQDNTIITKTSNYKIINIDNLKGKKLAVGKGWNTTKLLKKYYPDIIYVEYDTVSKMLEAVKNNFVDATIIDKMVATYHIDKFYPNELKTVSKVLLKEYNPNLHFATTQKMPILQSIINKGMDSISQEEKRILDKKWLNINKIIQFTQEEQTFINNTTIHLATPAAWAPFVFKDKNEKLQGIAMEYWEYIANKANLKIKYSYVDKFPTTLKMIKEKKSDISLATSSNKEREQYALFTKPYLSIPIGIATLKEKAFIQKMSFLNGKKVGVGKNYSAHKLLLKHYPNIQFVEVKNVKEGLELLSSGQIFAFADIMPVLSYNIKEGSFTNLKISGKTDLKINLRMMIRDDYPQLQSIIEKVLRHMTKEEEESINKKWFRLEINQTFDYTLLWQIIAIFSFVLLIILYKNRQMSKYQEKLKQTKKDLEETVTNFKALVNLTIEGIIIINKKKNILYINKQILDIFHVHNDKQIIGMNILNLFDTIYHQDVLEIIEKAVSDNHEINSLNFKKEPFPTLIRCERIKFKNEESHIISIVDITDIKNKEALIIEQSKMASLGEMIANIAHQWRQPLSSISTSASGMKLQKEYNKLDDKAFNDTLDNIIDSTQFLSQTINDFQNYIKNDKVKKEFKLKENIHTVLNIMKGTLNNNFIKVHLDISPHLLINTYENELHQVLLNILNNSKDALKNLESEDRNIFINTQVDHDNVYINIIDNGGGINEEIIGRVCEPYFTTKHKTQGTGLGLYMTHKIITESLKGEVHISNISFKNFSHCTSVTITLPQNK